MEYRGYVGTVQYSPEDRVFHGRIAGVRDVITFEGDSVHSLEDDFRRAVEDYLSLCAKHGRESERQVSE